MKLQLSTVACAILVAAAWPAGADAPLDAGHMARADRLIEQAIEDGATPGAVLLVGRGEEVLHRAAYGHALLEPERRAMTPETVFDAASLTKPIATATSIMILAERGEIDPTAPVASYLPDFAANGKDGVTVADLLLHRGGLAPANPLSDYDAGPDAAIAGILRSPPTDPPGEGFRYTDLGYIVLGELVRAVDGRPLDRFAAEEIFEPLSMTRTTFNPPVAWRGETAGSSRRGGRMLIGEVHDPRAARVGGVAGHAGLFTTADDLARFARMILNGGELDGTRILSEESVAEMTRVRWLPDGTDGRTYGFDADTAYSSARGHRFERGATFGHTGFTGPALWLDPGNGAYIVFMANRLHPDERGGVVPLRRELATVAAEALLGPGPDPNVVMTGIDVLAREDFAPLAGRRVGLITNHTGVDRHGRRTIDVLHGAGNVELAALFSPEHGLLGELDERVGHAVDEATGLRVWSLYGETRRPTPEMLEEIDTLVFDVQDIGTRFYTYISTMGMAMEAAAEHDVRFIVLDRPNPLTGLRTDGPIADDDKLSFVAYRPLPLVHGMTVGELARMFNAEHHIEADLEIVKMVGWRRAMWWDETGLTWINPSPNMRKPKQAVLYPGVGLIEYTNVSVGRGTDEPFERFGAPWIDPDGDGHRRLAAALNAADLPGVRFTPIVFTPESSRHAGERCGGVHILLTDRDAYEPARTGLTIAHHLKRLFGEDWDHEPMIRLLVNQAVHDAWQRAENPADLPTLWADDLDAFNGVRERYLIYR